MTLENVCVCMYIYQSLKSIITLGVPIIPQRFSFSCLSPSFTIQYIEETLAKTFGKLLKRTRLADKIGSYVDPPSRPATSYCKTENNYINK